MNKQENNYYDEIIGKINHLIEENHWDQANMLIKHELEMPYIPLNVLPQLSLLQGKVISHIKSNMKAEIKDWNLSEISEILMNPFDEEIHPVAFHYLETQNARLIMPVIEKYLVNPTFNNINKTILLHVLKQQEIDITLKVVKSHGNFNVNPSKMKFWYETPLYQVIAQMFEKKVYVDDINLSNICTFLLDSYMENLFPDLPEPFQASGLAAALHYRAGEILSTSPLVIKSAQLFETNESEVERFLKIISTQQIS